ncbi:leucine-rich repeats and immunoglobulin-like domains protein 1 [Cephus cinctus]|uniref:Leucine-rich repeats and immunoglobulin-like domains protein 1 n=1 Tax=Cephus cinctus TaxID=211228 RepID=A0AAJ7BQQ6_CEPCN|nr:leucine-rich repeats and immunoglobulin-like domains protein 1 [Cephus cinctus]
MKISKLWSTVFLHVFLLALAGCQETESIVAVDGIYLDEICNQTENGISINFESMGLNSLRSKFLSSSHVIALNLRGNGISTIARDAFARLPNLCYLDLSLNPSVQDVIYANFPVKLKVLVLDSTVQNYDGYRSYDSGEWPTISRVYPEVKYLYLRSNKLSKFNYRWKLLFPNVTHLFLSHNNFHEESISSIPESVTHLYLENNNIKTFRIQDFPNVVSLALDGNNIEYINSNYNNPFARDGNNLEILSLGNINIRKIHPDAFSYMNNLKSLNLSHNQISDLDTKIFSRTLHLETLFLNHNELSTIPDVCGLPQLESLSLQYNKIRSVSANTFCDTMTLKYLNLAGNQISNLQFDKFENLKRLEVLDLSHNILHELSADWNLSLNLLTDLHLNENYFEDLDHLYLNNTSALQNLYLLNNPIKTLNTDSLRHIKNLNLHLSYGVKCDNILS